MHHPRWAAARLAAAAVAAALVVLPAGPALAQDPVAPTAPGELATPPAPQPLTPEAGGAPPDWGPFTIDRTAWETWGGAIQSGDLSQVLRPESIGYTGAGIPFSLGILSTTDGFGSALAAQPATIVRGLTGQTLLNSRLFIDPAVNFGANMAADGAVIYGVDHLGRELQAANGWFLTERGRQYVQYANTLPPGQRNQFLEYIVSNRNRPANPASPSTLSTRRLDSGRPGTLLQASGLILGGNEFVIPQVDAALSPGLARDADGRPILQTDQDWLNYYGPRALNVGLGVAVPFTVESVRSGRTPRQTALTAGLGFGLPGFQTLLTNAALNPPQDDGLVRSVGVPVAEGLTRVADGVGGWWEQVDERPEGIVDPWARWDGLAVQTGAAVLGPVADVAGQLGTLGAGRYVAGEGLANDVLTAEGRAALDRRVASADATLRTYGQPGVAAAELLGGAGSAVGGLWEATAGVLGQANETVWRTGEAVVTGQAQWQGGLQGSPYQVRRTAAGVLERVEPAVQGAPIPSRVSEGVHDWAAGVSNAWQDSLAPETGPCDDPRMRCWGRHAGELLVGPATSTAPRLSECTSAVQSGCIVAGSRDPRDPNSVGRLQVGVPAAPAAPRLAECTSAVQSGCIVAGSRDPANPASVGRLQVGAPAVPAPVVSGGQWDRAARAAASSWDRTVSGDVGGVVRDGVGCVTSPRACWTGRPASAPPPPSRPASSAGGDQVQRATQAAGSSWDRVQHGDVGGVLRDGWNCVTNPARCWNGD